MKLLLTRANFKNEYGERIKSSVKNEQLQHKTNLKLTRLELSILISFLGKRKRRGKFSANSYLVLKI